jgi:trk system potassium uptake protein TrkA
MRIIIAGGGEIGLQFARELSVDNDVVVIEEDPEAMRPFESLDVQVTRGKPTHIDTLRRVNLGPEDKFVACSESDEQNVIACMAAKRLGGPQTFCFVSKEEYYESFRHGGEEDAFTDIDEVIWPQLMLAKEISRIVLVPEAIDVEVFAGGRIWLMEYRLQEDSPLVGKRITEIGLPKRVLAVGLIHGEGLHIPHGDTIFDAGDKVVFMGRRKALTKFARSMFQQGKSGVSEVTVIGGGTVGVTLAKMLDQGGVRLKLIELDKERSEQIAAELDCMVLHGDGSDLALLRSENIADSDVLVSVTSDDDKNLLGSLLAKQMGIPKIITRVNKQANIPLFESVGIDVPLNARITAVAEALSLLRGTSAQLLATLEQGKAQVLEIVVPDDYPVTQVRKLPPVNGAIIGAVVRGWRTVVPHGDDYIRPGDHLLVVSTENAKEAVEQYF